MRPNTTGQPTSVVLPLLYIVATVAFTLTWLILGYINDGYAIWDIVIEIYSPITQPISGLGLGNTAFAMNTAFVIYGLISIVGAVGISRNLGQIEPKTERVALVTIGLHALGAVLAGIFTLEQMSIHSIGFLLVLAPIVGFTIIGRRVRPHERWSRLGGLLVKVATPVSLLLLALFYATFNPEASGNGEGFAGLTQRAFIVFVQAWLVVIAWRTSRKAEPVPEADQAITAE